MNELLLDRCGRDMGDGTGEGWGMPKEVGDRY